MKANTQHTARFISLIAAGLLVASASHAATTPSSIFDFSAGVTDDVFKVKSKGWRDPAFGDMGWTHSSDWGTVNAKKGQTVTLTIETAAAGIHPGATVFYRGTDDTAPDNYVVDHFYPQNANFTKFGATADDGTKLGNIIMHHVIHGYDMDGNTKKIMKMKPITDGIPGKLTLSFKAQKTGAYMFVVGGFNPDASVDLTGNPSFDVNVNVTVTGRR